VHLSFGRVLLITAALCLLFLFWQGVRSRARRAAHGELPRRQRERARAIDAETQVAMHAQQQIAAMGEHTGDRLTHAAMGHLRRGSGPGVSDGARGALLRQTEIDGAALAAIQQQHIASVQRVLVAHPRASHRRSPLRFGMFLLLLGGLLYWRLH